MPEFSDYTETELREELRRRQWAKSLEFKRRMDERYGTCPECGGGIRELASNVVQEFWEAKGWTGWPMPPPEDWYNRERIGAEWEIAITCVNRHVRYEREVKFAAMQGP